MERLLIKSKQKSDNIPDIFFRYLYHEINLNNRLIAIPGARGVGRTTLLLQIAKHSSKEVLYVPWMIYFSQKTLFIL
jgi:predicted AAA+ superfamily ATPase